MRSFLYAVLGVLVCSCAEAPRVFVQVDTDLNVPDEVDHLTARVGVGETTIEEGAVLEGAGPYIFSIVADDGAPPTVQVEIVLARGDTPVVRASSSVNLPTEGEACVAVRIRRDGSSTFAVCGAAPKTDGGPQTPDGGVLDGGEFDAGTRDAGERDAGTPVDFPFIVKNVDPTTLDYGRPFTIPANRACTFDSTALTFTAGCGSPPPVAVHRTQPDGDDVAVISASAIDLSGNLTMIGTHAVVLVAGTTARFAATIDASATSVVPGAGAALGCTAGMSTNETCRRGGGGGGGGGGGPGALGGNGNNACAGGAGGVPIHLPTIEPLVGGCTGGFGLVYAAPMSAGGAGGGALQIVAREVIFAGTIHTSGGGGEGARLEMDGVSGGGGGGGGGALLVQAINIDVQSTAQLNAIGGGGGGGGETSKPGAPGGDGRGGGIGAPNVGNGGDGGDGAGLRPDPQEGDDADGSGGGGGGGAGTIRIEGTCVVDELAVIAPRSLGDCPR